MSAASDLPYLLRLLDDNDPAVRPVVSKKLSSFGGDISHDLAALGIQVNLNQKKYLADMLAAGSRQTLRDEWQIPSGGVLALGEDWEGFENILRQLSDFLHDGITLRPSMTDSLDMLVEEILEDIPVPSANDLRHWLFIKGKFRGAAKAADAEKYFDLSHVIEQREGNPTSLGCIFMLVGQRLSIQVDGCNYPGHFLNRISINGEAHLVDGFHRGRKFNIGELLDAHPEISNHAKSAVAQTSHLGVIILRCLKELESTFVASGKIDDAELFNELIKTLNT